MTPAWKLATSTSPQKKAWQRTAYVLARDKQPNKEIQITCNINNPIDYFEDPQNAHLFDNTGSIPPNLSLHGLQHLIFFLNHPDRQTARQAEFNIGFYLDPERGLLILNRLATSNQEWRHLSPMIEDYISNKSRRARLLISKQISLKTWSDYLDLYERALKKGHKHQKKYKGDFLCLDHFTRFREYLKYSTFFGRHGDMFSYYGCRKCESTINSVRMKNVVAVLDNSMEEATRMSYSELRINWLRYQKPFDFNVLEIGSCTEDDIANFCIHIGNDTDVYRSTRYSSVDVKVKKGIYLHSQSEAQLSRFFRL